jgi:hypothetical protein
MSERNGRKSVRKKEIEGMKERDRRNERKR